MKVARDVEGKLQRGMSEKLRRKSFQKRELKYIRYCREVK